ncbi:hypothetical protein BJ322DRAFT_1005050 [Thelephora terrestris]|uniref:Proteasome activator complex subunit 4 n=1 Tax=Thelephora terrestris TaxID=56493 RepID=A0A9P6HF98_9AGAM|nr:hypothetical protein BJ322DRAFT_1005050 [Thelephora terrestris]
MDLKHLSNLSIRDRGPNGLPDQLPRNSSNISPDRYLEKLKSYAKSLPYSIESNSEMQAMFEFICLRLCQCIEAKDFDPGFAQWDSMITYWLMLKYPIPKEKRIHLIRIYLHLATLPGMPIHIVATVSDGLQVLTRSKKKLTIEDLRLPWKPLFNIIDNDLFLSRRQFEISQISWYMGYIADNIRRFFHPAAIEEMLSAFVPRMNGTELNSVLASQYYMLTFLPLSHPQSFLPMLFRVWESVNSYMYDERMLQFLARLAEMHVDPTVSDPRKIKILPDDAVSDDEGRPQWPNEDLQLNSTYWGGLYKDVGIFTEYDWDFIMAKCLASMEIQLADSGSLHTGSSADSQATFEVDRLPKPSWRISSLARLIVYSMAPDSVPTPGSNVPTPALTPFQSGMNTPMPQDTRKGAVGDYLSAPLGKVVHGKTKTYLAGSRALDSLAKLIATVESFFHPSNSGAWTADLSAFIKYIVYDFNKRWHEEMQPDCKTPMHRRLTKEMRRELIRCLRTVALLAMFSQDSTTVTNIQSCLKSMSVMEPDLILHSILERAVPSLEALVETQRTIAVIKALGAVAPAIVSREVYYAGAKHLIPILQLLIPGIDLNDPLKTLCTTAFLSEVSQYIKLGDLTAEFGVKTSDLVDGPARDEMAIDSPPFIIERYPAGIEPGMEAVLSKQEEDALLMDSTGDLPDWIANFIRRVILLLENLPDEDSSGNADGATEVQVIDAVSGACSQICVHLSDNLYDMVLNMIFDYASNNVRSNAVRAIHQLVECVANANPEKTLAKFFYFCAKNIKTELENGASSRRTTTTSSAPLPSDATLHWNLAILRGAVYNDGKALLKYKKDILSLLRLLRDKTFSKRGYAWSGKLLSSMLLTLSHTYPLENRFVNPEEWNSEVEFRTNHHQHWGKLYRPDEIEMSWHVPSEEEIEFVLETFRGIVEPTLEMLESLLESGVTRDAVWRNDFCRYLSFVRNAFAGTPTLAKEIISEDDIKAGIATSDILNEIPEMIASIEPLNAGYPLHDPSDPRHQYMTRLRQRFGEFLHKSSVSLRQQGEENTLDAVHALVRSIRTYMLEYGDSRDNYYLQQERYNGEMSIARQYAGQKVWPRAVYVRRARCYHAARLRWSAVERRRGPLEDVLIDDLAEWSMWHYPSVRESSQTTLEALSASFDGVRQRCLPKFYEALEPGTEDDRMKGALWALNVPYLSKYAISEPTLAPDLAKHLFGCQQNEKPSIQECVSAMADNCLNSFSEPCYTIYDIQSPGLDHAAAELKKTIAIREDAQVVHRCQQKRIERTTLMNTANSELVRMLLEIAGSSKTHWRYGIVAVRCLRTLVRKDEPITASHFKFFVEKTCDDHPSIYSQRAVMKVLRFIKLRTTTSDPIDLILERNHNPLKKSLEIDNPSRSFTSQHLADLKTPVSLKDASGMPIYFERTLTGWLVWDKSIGVYDGADLKEPAVQKWEEGSQPAISAVQEVVQDKKFWEKLAVHYTSENQTSQLVQDNVSTVKSLFQLLGDVPFDLFKVVVEKYITVADKDKQRGAAELLAGILSASKHWSVEEQTKIWNWLTPNINKIFKQNIKTDTLPIWTSFLEYMFYHRDPRRAQPLVDQLVDGFNSVDFNGESTFAISQVLCFYRAFYEELGWRFEPWADDMIARVWPEIGCEHDEVRSYIGEMLAVAEKAKRRPKPSVPTTEAFVRECRTLPFDYDIMSIRGTYHKERVEELVHKFKSWREERLPGARAFQSTYDRVGVMVCKWLFQLLHDTNATSAFDYILPLMPEIFRFSEVNDNNELSGRADLLLVRMCGVTPPRSLISPMLDSIFRAIQTSPSWRVRLKVLPLLQVFYFRQVPLISEGKIVEIVEVVCRCLDDEVVEVREKAATTLSGILRLSPRRSILALKDRFLRLLRKTSIPSDRKSAKYNLAVRQRHAAILGVCALIDSYPYTVEKFMPELLTNVLAEHTYDPAPISTTVRKCASNFKKTHQDTWHEDSKRFTEEQLSALSTLLTGSSYCEINSWY